MTYNVFGGTRDVKPYLTSILSTIFTRSSVAAEIARVGVVMQFKIIQGH